MEAAGMIITLAVWGVVAVDAYRNEIDFRTKKPYTINNNPAVSWIMLMFLVSIPFGLVGGLSEGLSGNSILASFLLPHLAPFAGPAFYLSRRGKTLKERQQQALATTAEENESNVKKPLPNAVMVLLVVGAFVLSLAADFTIIASRVAAQTESRR